jgi:hypothetical protein
MHEETASDKGKGRQEPHLTKDQIKHLRVSSNKQTKWSGVIEMRGMKDSDKVTGRRRKVVKWIEDQLKITQK